ncbi:hypothetical protein FHX77_000836 [Bifidobacterium commune]|nr:hypothetical protein [Bifidobacterium commune]
MNWALSLIDFGDRAQWLRAVVMAAYWRLLLVASVAVHERGLEVAGVVAIARGNVRLLNRHARGLRRYVRLFT